MAKADPIGVRLEHDEREALIRAAEADERPAAAMARKVIAEWLRANGWLREQSKVHAGKSQVRKSRE